MFFSDRVTLIAETLDWDDIGNTVPAQPVEREVWADVRSISRAEFAAAGAAGLKPSLMAVVHACDYGGQTRLRWEGLTLEVYRTYRPGGCGGAVRDGETGEGRWLRTLRRRSCRHCTTTPTWQ